MAKVRSSLQEYAAKFDRSDSEKRKLAARIDEIMQMLPPALQSTVASSFGRIKGKATGKESKHADVGDITGDNFEDDNSLADSEDEATKFSGVEGAGDPQERQMAMRKQVLRNQALSNANSAARAGTVVRRQELAQRKQRERDEVTHHEAVADPPYHNSLRGANPSRSRLGIAPPSRSRMGSPTGKRGRNIGSVKRLAYENGVDRSDELGNRGGVAAARARKARQDSDELDFLT